MTDNPENIKCGVCYGWHLEPECKLEDDTISADEELIRTKEYVQKQQDEIYYLREDNKKLQDRVNALISDRENTLRAGVVGYYVEEDAGGEV